MSRDCFAYSLQFGKYKSTEAKQQITFIQEVRIMKSLKIKNAKRIALFTAFAISSATIQLLAQNYYPTFDYSTTEPTVQTANNSATSSKTK